MHPVSNTSRSFSDSETCWETGDSTDSSSEDHVKSQANSVPIPTILGHYGYKLDYRNKLICPFSFHKSGRENSGSFTFYPKTNSFYCFGCKTGFRAVDLVAKLDGISKLQAAYKILDYFSSEVDESKISDVLNVSEKLEIMLEFSNCVKEFRSQNKDEESWVFIENICKSYDLLNNKHQLDNKAIAYIVQLLKEKIESHENKL